jgi:probable HAF family extracellular repeat protein
MTLIPSLPGYTQGSRATGINDADQVAGYAIGSSATTGYTDQAFLYSNGTTTGLGVLPGGTSSEATAVNDAGQVVGFGDTAASSDDAFLYSQGKMIDLGVPPYLIGQPAGDTDSEATGINNSGQVIGDSHSGSLGTNYAFLYSNGQMTALTPPAGYDITTANGINNSGQVVGDFDGYGPSGTALPFQAFLYSGGKMTSLGALPGDSYSVALGINDLGQIVGESSSTAAGNFRAFYYSQKTGMVDLNSFLPANSG